MISSLFFYSDIRRQRKIYKQYYDVPPKSEAAISQNSKQ